MTIEQEIVKVNYNLRAGEYGGQLIYPSDWIREDLAKEMGSMPSEADLFTETVGQHYPIGTQLRKNGSLYRYSKAGAAVAVGHAGFLKINYLQAPGIAGNSANSGYEGNAYATAAVGATVIDISDTAAAKNEYEGAILTCMVSSAVYDRYVVIGNDVSDGTFTRLYIAPPGLKVALVAASSWIQAYLNAYISIASALSYNTTWYSCMGEAPFTITNDYYFWLHTAGPYLGTNASVAPGRTAYMREVYANTDGSLIGKTSTTYLYQRVGYLINGTETATGDAYIMLQLDQ